MKILCFLAFFIAAVTSANIDALYEINRSFSNFKSKGKLSNEELGCLNHALSICPQFVYGLQIGGYINMLHGDYIRAVTQFRSALQQMPLGATVLFYDVEGKAVVRREELLVNTALCMYRTLNHLDAEEYIKEAINMANRVYKRNLKGLSRLFSRYRDNPRAKSYRELMQSGGVGYVPISPEIVYVYRSETVTGMVSAAPWTVDERHDETNTQLALKRITRDGLGSVRIGGQRLPPDFEESDLYMVPLVRK